MAAATRPATDGAGRSPPRSGIDLDGVVAYTWSDADPEDAPDFVGFEDYDAIEFGIGTALTF